MNGELLVTGASGFVGRHLVTDAHRAGFAVTAVDTRPPPAEVAFCAVTVRARSADAAVLAAVREGRFAAVLHQSGITSTLETDREMLRAMNVEEPLELARACAESGTPFHYASSHSVYGHIHGRVAAAEQDTDDPDRCTGPLNAYAYSKLELDRRMGLLFGGDLTWTGYRYTNVFGTGEEHKGGMASIISQMLRAAADGRTLRLFSDTLDAHRDYVPVEVVSEAVLAAVRRPPPSGVYNLGSGQPLSFAALLGWCAEFRGDGELAVRLVPNPVRDRYQYWTCADQSALDRVVPDRAPCPPDRVKAAAERLFATFAGSAYGERS